jgi:pimeloyl-ACP methyl ester carboxylesterase
VVAHSFGGVATTIALHDGLDVARVVYVGVPARPRDSFARFASMLDLPASVMADVQRRLAARANGRSLDTMAPEAVGRGMTIPALIVHDRGDKEVPFADGVDLSAAWDAAELVATEDLGHYRILRDADVIERAVQFIEQPAHGADATPEWAQQWQARNY